MHRLERLGQSQKSQAEPKKPGIAFLGRRICLGGRSTILGVGSGRTRKLRKEALIGESCPLDGRLAKVRPTGMFGRAVHTHKRSLLFRFLSEVNLKHSEPAPECSAAGKQPEEHAGEAKGLVDSRRRMLRSGVGRRRRGFECFRPVPRKITYGFFMSDIPIAWCPSNFSRGLLGNVFDSICVLEFCFILPFSWATVDIVVLRKAGHALL